MTEANPIAVVTCLAITGPRVERIALESLRATTAEFPDDERFAAIDIGSPAVEEYCRNHGWTLVRPDPGPGGPPRMAALVKKCLELTAAPILWTIEHDCVIPRDRRDRVIEALLANPRVAGVECLTLNARGDVGYPATSKKLAPWPQDERLRVQSPWSSLTCVAWRTEALRQVDWSKVRLFPATDQDLSRELVARGWTLTCYPECTCVHHFTRARYGLAPPTDTVDVLITTYGRPSLRQALLAALMQTHPHTRTVVIADGPDTGARAVFEEMVGDRQDAAYYEMPERQGHGDRLKEWWFAHADASPFIRSLDDDDWMPACAIAEMMVPMADPSVVMSVCVVPTIRLVDGRCVHSRLVPGNLKLAHIGFGSILMRTESIRKPSPIALPRDQASDFAFIEALAERGVVARIPQYLYWYNGHRHWARRDGEWVRVETTGQHPPDPERERPRRRRPRIKSPADAPHVTRLRRRIAAARRQLAALGEDV